MKIVLCCAFWLFIVLVCNFEILTANNGEVEIKNYGAKPEILLYRFESPVSPGPAWDLLREPLGNLSRRDDREAFAIRICSENKLLLAIPAAVVDPFQIIKIIRSRYAKPSEVPPIYLLRSTNCGSTYVPVEVWAVGKNGKLPAHIESYDYKRLRVQQLGFNPSVCSTGKIDHRTATKMLINKLRRDWNSFGVIIGYYDSSKGSADPDLRKRVEQARNLMERSGISRKRYSISYEIWHADDSECSAKPVTKPSIYFLALKRL